MSNDTLTIKFDSYPYGAGSSNAKTIITSTYGIYVLDCNDDDAPEPDYEPKSSGCIYLYVSDNFLNFSIVFACFILIISRKAYLSEILHLDIRTAENVQGSASRLTANLKNGFLAGKTKSFSQHPQQIITSLRDFHLGRF